MQKIFLLVILAVCSTGFLACANSSRQDLPKLEEVSDNQNISADAPDAGPPQVITREEFDKDKPRFGREALEMGSKVGKGANDLWLWTKINSEISVSADLRDVKITIDVEDEVVTLRGSLRSPADKEKILKLANSIEGVKSVTDKLNAARNNKADDGKSDADKTKANSNK